MTYSKPFLYALLAAPIAIFFFVFAFAAHAQNSFDAQFPIAELGGCNSVEECFSYCEDPANTSQCRAWAEANGFEEGDDTRHEEVKEVLEDAGTGPGGCTSPEECDAFCSDAENIKECFEFAKEHNLIGKEEAERIEKTISLRDEGGPGGCEGHEACEAFCNEPANQTMCLDFAVEKGFMPAEQAAQIKGLLSGELPGLPQPGEFGPQINRKGSVGPGEPQINVERAAQVLEELGGGPGGCADFEACEAFCDNPANSDTCFAFAEEHELMPQEEIEKFKKLSNVQGPGGCRGRECEAYCEAPGRERECLDFAHKQGFMSEEEFEKVNRFVTVIEEKGGPGGCRGRECETFCNNPENRDQCFEFAKSNNLLPPGELERIEKFKAIDEKVKSRGGPGGCRGENECRAYCSDTSHFDECAAFAVNEGFLDPKAAEQSLRQFIEIEEQFKSQIQSFGPDGFRPGSQGFSPDGFGTSGGGNFPPGFEQIPEEFRSKVEEQFKSRFDQFKEMRGQFERGKIPQQEDFEGGFPGDFPNESGQFHGAPGQFPGVPGEFPDRGPERDGFTGTSERPEGFIPGIKKPFDGENNIPGDRFVQPKPFEGEYNMPRPGVFEQQFQGEVQKQFQNEVQRQFQSEVQKQFEQQYQQEFQRQFEQQSGGFPPPPSGGSGSFRTFNQQLPTKSFTEPVNTGSFDGGNFQSPPPPAGSFDGGSQPPPPPPGASGDLNNFFANVLSIFNPPLR